MKRTKLKKQSKVKISVLKKKYNNTYYKKYKQECLVRSKNYYVKNKKNIMLRNKEYYKHRKLTEPGYLKKCIEKSKIYYRKNIIRKLAQSRERWKIARLELLKQVGGTKCKICNFSDYRALQVDHLNGGGRKELRENKSIRSVKLYMKHILNNPDRYQILCANCNWIKRYENQETRKIN